MIVAGVGCRRQCPADALLALIAAAATQVGPLAALAAPWFKREQPALLAAAAALGLPIAWVSEAELRAAQPRCITRSERVHAATGHPSIAEASALAAAGAGARLLLARIASPHATCAVAGP